MNSQFIVLFAIMFTGYLLRKLNIIDSAMNHGLNKFIVYFAYPCLIVHNIGTLDLSREMIFNFVFMVVLTLCFFVISTVYVYFYSKLRKFPKANSNIVEFASVAPNDGFMGFPIALIFFGEKGLLFMLAHNAALNLYFFTHGLRLVRRNKEGKRKLTPGAIPKAVMKLITNPNILGLFVGFIISISGWHIPSALSQYLQYIGQVATPMAMIFIGSTLAECKVKEMVKDHIVIEASINKLIILPLITLGAALVLPLNPLMKACLILGGAFPTGATVSMLAEQEGQDQKMSSKILFFSTVLSIITIPVTIEIIKILIM